MKTCWLCLHAFGNPAISQQLECEIRQMAHPQGGLRCIWEAGHRTASQSGVLYSVRAKKALIAVHSQLLNAAQQSSERHERRRLRAQAPPLPLTLCVILCGDLRFGFSNP